MIRLLILGVFLMVGSLGMAETLVQEIEVKTATEAEAKNLLIQKSSQDMISGIIRSRVTALGYGDAPIDKILAERDKFVSSVTVLQINGGFVTNTYFGQLEIKYSLPDLDSIILKTMSSKGVQLQTRAVYQVTYVSDQTTTQNQSAVKIAEVFKEEARAKFKSIEEIVAGSENFSIVCDTFYQIVISEQAGLQTRFVSLDINVYSCGNFKLMMNRKSEQRLPLQTDFKTFKPFFKNLVSDTKSSETARLKPVSLTVSLRKELSIAEVKRKLKTQFPEFQLLHEQEISSSQIVFKAFLPASLSPSMLKEQGQEIKIINSTSDGLRLQI